MSIQAECREAMNRLSGRGAIFTEIDVANEASSDGWSSKQFEQAMKHAYNVLQGDYKKGKLVRYGPVAVKGIKDYARRASKIVYAHAEQGPTFFQTPNGDFPRLHAETDELVRAGRRVGTNRDDTKSWEAQDISVRTEVPKGPAIDPKPLLKKIEEQQAEIRRLTEQASALNGNGNGNGGKAAGGSKPEPSLDSAIPVSLSELVDLLADRVTPRVEVRALEYVKNSMAEALIS